MSEVLVASRWPTLVVISIPKRSQGEEEIIILKRHPPCALLLCCLVFFYVLVLLLQPAWAMDVTLAWDANTETDLAGYKIYYGKTTGGPYDDSASTDGASPIVVPLGSLLDPANPEFTVRDLPSETYYFVATAYDTEGYESLFSNEATKRAIIFRPTPAPILLLLLED
jgi:hypothetical protein